MNRRQLRTVLARELEDVTQGTFWSADDLNDVLNDAYMEMSDASEWYEIWRNVAICHTRPYYDVRTVFYGQTVLNLHRAFSVDTNRWLDLSAWKDLDRMYSRWEQVRPSLPSRIIRRGLWWFGYWPISGSESGTIKQYATALPPTMDDDEDSPGFHEVFHRGLIEYGKAELLPQAGEVSKGLAAWRVYEDFEAGLTEYVSGRGTIPERFGHGGYVGTGHTQSSASD